MSSLPLTMQTAETNKHSPQRKRTLLALGAGFFSVFVLSLGTDQLLHVLDVYPPWGQPMHEPALNLLALGYRVVYGVFGSYLAARLAPNRPMRHAVILGVIGFFLSLAGAIGALSMTDLGPSWYPIALVLTTLPGAWLGGALQQKHSKRNTRNIRGT